jgi:hypothetical protein
MRCLLICGTVLTLAVGSNLSAARADVIGQGDPFIFNFDEAGNGSYRLFLGPTLGYGKLVNDPGFILDGFLTYALPEPVTLGDVGIADPSQTCTGLANCSDGLRFVQHVLPNGSPGFVMQFYSQVGGGLLADAGFSPDFNPTAFATEIGDNFQYVAGSGDPAFTNFYNGVSGVSSVPEPGTLALIGTVLAGWGVISRRRKRASPSQSAA